MAKPKRAATDYQIKRQKYWTGMIAKWLQSGLSQAAFCQRHALSAQQFSQWKGRLAKIAKVATELTADADFIEIKSSVAASCVYEIVTPTDYRIRIEGDYRSEVLADMLLVVGRSC